MTEFFQFQDNIDGPNIGKTITDYLHHLYDGGHSPIFEELSQNSTLPERITNLKSDKFDKGAPIDSNGDGINDLLLYRGRFEPSRFKMSNPDVPIVRNLYYSTPTNDLNGLSDLQYLVLVDRNPDKEDGAEEIVLRHDGVRYVFSNTNDTPEIDSFKIIDDNKRTVFVVENKDDYGKDIPVKYGHWNKITKYENVEKNVRDGLAYDMTGMNMYDKDSNNKIYSQFQEDSKALDKNLIRWESYKNDGYYPWMSYVKNGNNVRLIDSDFTGYDYDLVIRPISIWDKAIKAIDFFDVFTHVSPLGESILKNFPYEPHNAVFDDYTVSANLNWKFENLGIDFSAEHSIDTIDSERNEHEVVTTVK